MKPLGPFKRGLARVRQEWRSGRYAAALAETSRLLKQWPDNPQLLVTWADLIQLQDAEEGPTLAEAKAAYRRAAVLDDQSPAPLIELGHYLYAIEDDAKAASPLFTKAVSLARRQLRQALMAQAKALMELDRKREAFGCLKEAIALESSNGKAAAGEGEAEILDQLKELARSE